MDQHHVDVRRDRAALGAASGGGAQIVAAVRAEILTATACGAHASSDCSKGGDADRRDADRDEEPSRDSDLFAGECSAVSFSRVCCPNESRYKRSLARVDRLVPNSVGERDVDSDDHVEAARIDACDVEDFAISL